MVSFAQNVTEFGIGLVSGIAYGYANGRRNRSQLEKKQDYARHEIETHLRQTLSQGPPPEHLADNPSDSDRMRRTRRRMARRMGYQEDIEAQFGPDIAKVIEQAGAQFGNLGAEAVSDYFDLKPPKTPYFGLAGVGVAVTDAIHYGLTQTELMEPTTLGKIVEGDVGNFIGLYVGSRIGNAIGMRGL